MALQTARLTYDQYIAAPEIKARYDILDGEMIMGLRRRSSTRLFRRESLSLSTHS